MLKVKLTENYAGVEISGDFDDLANLYNSISYFIGFDADNIVEAMVQNHVYAFLYDLRHAYQGDREIELVDNGLADYKREWHGIRKKDVTDKNVYFSFHYILPDVILDMMLMKYFIKKVNKKYKDEYNPNITMVNYFYSLVLYSLVDFLTPIKFNKVKKGLMDSAVSLEFFLPQWFEIISIDYANMTKSKREKEFMHVMDSLYNYFKYDEYFRMKRALEKECKENNYNLDSIHYDGYPKEIEW